MTTRLVKGSPAAKAWAKKMKQARLRAQKARDKKNPGEAYHVREAGFAHGIVRTTPDPDEKVFYAGVESAHRISASSAKRLGMNQPRTHQLTNSEADALYKYASSIRNRGKRRYAYALYEYVLGGQRGLGPDWKSYGIQIMTEQAVRQRFATEVPALLKYDENPVAQWYLGVLEKGTLAAKKTAYPIRQQWIRAYGPFRSKEDLAEFVEVKLKRDPRAVSGLMGTFYKNPITIVGNPPNGCPAPPESVNSTVSGVLYCNVIEIQAEKKVKYKGFWYHPFRRKSQIQMLALDNGDLCIHSVNGTPLWARE